MNTKQIHISEYDYELPDERIAKFPIACRDQSKLLVYHHGEVKEDVFCNLSHYLPSGALMIFNNTRVIQARIHFRKATGALIEVFLLEPAAPADYEQVFQARGRCSWFCMVGNLKKWKEGTLHRSFNIHGKNVTLTVKKSETLLSPSSQEDGFVTSASPTDRRKETPAFDFQWDNCDVSFSEILEAVGELPIPPYLNRKTQESDKTTYQTVYSKIEGSVAAPTAGLHFTSEVLQSLDSHGIDREELTLHVGAGTFKPVKSVELKEHEMHAEYISVHRQTIEKLIHHNAQAIAVGTTSVRTLESLYYIGMKLEYNPNATDEELHVCQWEPYEEVCSVTSEKERVNKTLRYLQNIIDYLDRNQIDTLCTSTQIIIAPGYEYKIVKMLVTNFHQPKSTLLLLVSAFVHGDWRKIYDYALTHDFRFLSYGDSSLLIP